MRKIGQARNTLMDMRLSQVTDASLSALFTFTLFYISYSAVVVLMHRVSLSPVSAFLSVFRYLTQ